MNNNIFLSPLLLVILSTTSCKSNDDSVKVSEAKYAGPVGIVVDNDSPSIHSGKQNDSVLLTKNQTPIKVVSLYNDKLEIMIPVSLEQMDGKKLANKYPNSNPPEVAFSNENGSVNIAFRYNSRVTIGNDAAKLVQMLTANLKSAGLESESKIESINGRDFAMVEFVSDASNAKIYNQMVATVIDGQVLICTFNCTTKSLNEWKAIGEACLTSIKVKD